ncbi:MAG: PulJ/GspJ family protein [Myxococcales bacterium]|jgi:type IV pilus assembly protein PilW
MSRRLPTRSRGFTLTEITVGIAITGIVLMGITGATILTSTAMESEFDIRRPADDVRIGMGYLERVTRLAGYGVDPRNAFDFSTTGIDTKDNYAEGDFLTDDLAFRYRDPAYLRRGKLDSTGATLTLDDEQTLGIALPKGQALILICPGAEDFYVARLSDEAAANATSADLVAYDTPFSDVVPGCLKNVTGTQAAYVTLLHDIRLRVMPLGGVPYLVVLYGFGDPANTRYAPVLRNVRDFQVAYEMNRPPPNLGVNAPDMSSGNDNWILGDHAEDPLPNPAADAPSYDTEYMDSVRFSAHPANIRGLRISISVYGDHNPEAARRSSFYAAENSTAVARPNRFNLTVGTAVRLPNMASRTFFVPPLQQPGTDDDSNRWGG